MEAVIVTAIDVFGQVAVGHRGTVHFSSTVGSAALPVNYRFTAADNGRHIFTVTPSTVGTASVTASDTNSSAISGTMTITVRPAKVKLSAPASIPVGTSFPRTITLLNLDGSIAADYTGAISISVANDMLPPSYTFTVADKGAHTLSSQPVTAEGSLLITIFDPVDHSILGSATVQVV